MQHEVHAVEMTCQDQDLLRIDDYRAQLRGVSPRRHGLRTSLYKS